jgi:hypothetical protein
MPLLARWQSVSDPRQRVVVGHHGENDSARCHPTPAPVKGPLKVGLGHLESCPRNPQALNATPKSCLAFHVRRPMAGSCRVSRFGDVTRWHVKPRKQD